MTTRTAAHVLSVLLPRRAVLASVGAAVALVGCGFKLQDSAQTMPFQRLLVEAPGRSPLLQELEFHLRQSGVEWLIPPLPVGAERPWRLQVLQDQRERSVVGATAAGQVREILLRHRFRFRVLNAQGREVLSDRELTQERDLSYSESEALGKDAEEALLYQDMERSLVRQLLYRLSALPRS